MTEVNILKDEVSCTFFHISSKFRWRKSNRNRSSERDNINQPYLCLDATRDFLLDLATPKSKSALNYEPLGLSPKSRSAGLPEDTPFRQVQQLQGFNNEDLVYYYFTLVADTKSRQSLLK